MKDGSTRIKAGVAGWPVIHSLSPALHSAWIKAAGIDADYIAIPTPPERAAATFNGLSEQGFAGVNVTAPLKVFAYSAATSATDVAKRIGAANLLVVRDGGLAADNTDAEGFLWALRQAGAATDGPALVYGAGGAARAIVAGLLEAGSPRIEIANRTRDRAIAVAEHFDDPHVVAVGWRIRSNACGDAKIIVNATSLGRSGGKPLDVNLQSAPDDAVVFDAVYTPVETLFLKDARERGLRIADGLDMLIGQARPSFKALFGVDAPDSVDARAVLLDALGARR